MDEQLREIRIAALERRIEREKDFIDRMLAKRKGGKGIYKDTPRYTPLLINRFNKKSKTKPIMRDFFVWDWASISPYQIIADAEQRIKELENEGSD